MAEVTTDAAALNYVKSELANIIADSAERHAAERVQYLLEIQNLRHQVQQLTGQVQSLQVQNDELMQAKEPDPTSEVGEQANA